MSSFVSFFELLLVDMGIQSLLEMIDRCPVGLLMDW
jgi:hypothetical protein